MAQRETLDLIAEEIAALLLPLKSGLSSPEQAIQLLNALGWDLPAGVQDIGLTGIDVKNLIEKLEIMINSVGEEENDAILMASRSANLLTAAVKLIEDISRFAKTLTNMAELSQNYLQKTAIEDQFFTRLMDLLLIKYFENNHYSWFCALHLLGVFKITQEEAEPDIYQVQYLKYKVNYDHIPLLFKEPNMLFQRVYGWNTAGFDPQSLLANLSLFLQSFGAYTRLRNMPPKAEEQLAGRAVPEAASSPMPQLDVSLIRSLAPWEPLDVGLRAYGLRPASPNGVDGGIGITPFAEGTMDFSFPLFGPLFLDIDTTFNLQGGVALLARPSQFMLRTDLSGQGQGALAASGKLLLALRVGKDGADPVNIFVIPGGSRLQFQKIYIGFGAEVDENQKLNLFAESGFQGGKLIVTASEGDGFLQKILPKDPLEIDFDLILGISSKKGLYIKGGAGLSYSFHINKTIGPISVSTLDLKIGFKDQDIVMSLGVSGGLALGPIAAVVQNIGMKATLELGKRGNLGNSNLELGFKPPDGLGMSIETSVIKGGGYLMFDPDQGQYAGALELSFQDKFSLSAIGILTTKMPDGSKGYSLLIIITAKFPPITLGFGFFLNGLGGLLGLERTIAVDAMRQGVQQGSVDHILFPEHIIANITQIISDLQTIFPPARDQFIIGPMALITWSNPAIISVKLGLLIEFANPFRINVLGVLRATLPPAMDTPLIQIQVNFFGCIDFQRGFLTFDASLFDSYLGYKDYKFSLAGDMALRIFWGDQKEFLVSVGGFHPAFKPSASLLLPKMKRLTLSLLSGNPHLTLTTYFALTSNTVQFGSAIDFYYKVSKFKITGYFGFDVLFQFSPFYFLADLTARLAVELGDTVLFSIGLDFTLQGPSPWHARGTAEFKVLFFTYHADFDKTFGEHQDTTLSAVEVMPQLLAAFNQASNWRNEFQATPYTTVSLRQLEDTPDQVVLHGHDILTIHQNVMPLNTSIDLFGQSRPQDIKLAAIDSVAIGAQQLELEPVQDLFSPALFKVMSDSDKLKAPSFVSMCSGVKARGEGGLSAKFCSNRPVYYEVLVSDEEPDESGETQCAPVSQGVIPIPKNRFVPFIHGGAVSQSPLSKANGRNRLAVKKRVKVTEEAYTVVFTGDLKRCSPDFVSGSRAEAEDVLRALLKSNPDWNGKIQIMPEFQAVKNKQAEVPA